jgi:hypothetical protein
MASNTQYNSITVPSGQSPTPDSNEANNSYTSENPKMTRRQLLTSLAASAITLTTLTPTPASLGNSEDEPEGKVILKPVIDEQGRNIGRAKFTVTPPAAPAPAPTKKPKITHCQAEAYIPDRDSIQDPDTLAEYMRLMEARLEEETQRLRDIAAEEGQIVTDTVRNGQRLIERAGPFRDSLAEELCALIDSLAALLTAAEMAGYGHLIEEYAAQTDGYFDSAIVAHQGLFRPGERQEWINQQLWGEEPPPASEKLLRFDAWHDILLDTLSGKQLLAKNWGGAA